MLAARWPCVGRDAERERIIALLTEPVPRAVMLAGPAGSGKTHLLLECVDTIRGAGRTARVHSGARWGQEATPDFDAASSVAGALVVVEDAHLLGPDAAARLHAAVASADRPYLLTVRTGEPVAEPIRALWVGGFVERIDLRPLTQHDIHRLLEIVLGGPVDEALPMALGRRSGGNLVYLRELVRTAVEEGAVVDDHGIRRASRPLPLSPRVAEIVMARLEGLSDDERGTMEVVALAGTAGSAEVGTLIDTVTVEALERRKLLHTELAGRRLQVRVAEPVMGEVLIAETPRLRVRRVAGELATMLENTGCRREGDALRLAGLRLLAGGGSPGIFLAGAAAARAIQDLPLAERLARAAVAEGAGTEAELLAATLAGLQGRDDECQRELADLEIRAVSEEQRARVARAREEHRAIWMGTSDSHGAEGAAPVAEVSRGTERDAGPDAEHDAGPEAERDVEPDDEQAASGLGVLVLTVGPGAGAARAATLLDHPRPNVRSWATIVLGYSLSRIGRCQDALRVAASGQASHSPVEWFATWDRWWHVFNRCEALLHAGQIHEARELAITSYEHALVQAWQEEQAFFAWQLCRIHYCSGQLATAARYGRVAASLFRHLGRAAYVRAAEINLALAEARAGRVAEAERALEAVTWPGPAVPSMLRADYRRAQAWIRVARGELGQAREQLRMGCAEAAACHDLAGESAALYDLARLGGLDAARRLGEITAVSDSELDAVRADFAHACVDGDPSALEESSYRFGQLGHILSAAECSGEAAARWARQGRARRAAAAERRGSDLARTCEGAIGVEGLAARATLTPAEHETAALAIAGQSNREIAQTLVLSRSTVENRLQRVYHKLGITSRKELAQVLGR
jgi:DNA-binding CsgD family transcriptional regulator